MSNLLTEGGGIILGVGVGAAAAAAIEPAAELPRQDAWRRNPNRLLDPAMLARLIAQGGVPLDQTAYDDAKREGFDTDKLDALVYLAQTVPGVSEALTLWRLGLIGEKLFEHVLTKAGLDTRYVAPLKNRKLAEVIGLGDVATAVVRGILPSPPYVPVAPPTSGDKVPRYPMVDIDPETLAAKLGFDPEMLHIMVGRSGLSLAPGLAAQASFRDIIGPNDYLLAIAEGDLRTEWAETLHEVSRQIVTSAEAVENHLRGWSDAPTMYRRTARHGMTPEDTDILFQNIGRPLAVHQITTGLARGGKYGGDYTDVPAGPYRDAIRRSNIRPEYAALAYANRYSYPSGFQIKSEAPELGYADTNQILLEVGWSPHWADFFATKWTGGTTAAATPAAVKSEQTRLRTTTHRSYVGNMSDDTAATRALTAAGVDAADIPAILTIWQAERDLIRAQLSAADIRKAYQKNALNEATGAAWTVDDAQAALLDRGWSAQQAQDYLQIPAGGG